MPYTVTMHTQIQTFNVSMGYVFGCITCCYKLWDQHTLWFFENRVVR